MDIGDVKDAVRLLEKKSILRIDNIIINGLVNRTVKADYALAAAEGYKLEK